MSTGAAAGSSTLVSTGVGVDSTTAGVETTAGVDSDAAGSDEVTGGRTTSSGLSAVEETCASVNGAEELSGCDSWNENEQQSEAHLSENSPQQQS